MRVDSAWVESAQAWRGLVAMEEALLDLAAQARVVLAQQVGSAGVESVEALVQWA